MAGPVAINIQAAAAATPQSYTVPGSTEVEPLSAFARFDGTAAAGPWLPCLSFFSSGGLLLARVFPDGQLAVGDTADVTYSPSLSSGQNAGQSAAPFKLISAATTNSTLVSTGAHLLTGYYIANLATATRYVKLYDKASAPTVGTDTPKWTLPIPAGAAANMQFTDGLELLLGLGLGITTGVADGDTGAVGASEVVVNLAFV